MCMHRNAGVWSFVSLSSRAGRPSVFNCGSKKRELSLKNCAFCLLLKNISKSFQQKEEYNGLKEVSSAEEGTYGRQVKITHFKE